MFGTNRKISDFSLRIVKGPTNQTETCHVFGGIRNTSEWDFEQVTYPDYIQIEVVLAPLSFNQLKETIALDADKTRTLTLKGVRGSYSEWSPSIRTSSIKVLANPKDHGLEIPAGVLLPILGEVGECQLTISNEKKMAVPSSDDEDEVVPKEATAATAPERLSGFDTAYRRSML